MHIRLWLPVLLLVLVLVGCSDAITPTSVPVAATVEATEIAPLAPRQDVTLEKGLWWIQGIQICEFEVVAGDVDLLDGNIVRVNSSTATISYACQRSDAVFSLVP